MPLVRMRERVTFQRRLQVSDGAGNTRGGWDTDPPNAICTTAARLRPINGREDVLAQKLQGTQGFELTVRYSAAAAQVTAGCRAVNMRTGACFDIKTIQNPDERRMYLSMIVTEGVGDS